MLTRQKIKIEHLGPRHIISEVPDNHILRQVKRFTRNNHINLGTNDHDNKANDVPVFRRLELERNKTDDIHTNDKIKYDEVVTVKGDNIESKDDNIETIRDGKNIQDDKNTNDNKREKYEESMILKPDCHIEADHYQFSTETEKEFDKIYEELVNNENLNIESTYFIPIEIQESNAVDLYFNKIIREYEEIKINDTGKIKSRVPLFKQKSLHEVLPKRIDRRSSLKEFESYEKPVNYDANNIKDSIYIPDDNSAKSELLINLLHIKDAKKPVSLKNSNQNTFLENDAIEENIILAEQYPNHQEDVIKTGEDFKTRKPTSSSVLTKIALFENPERKHIHNSTSDHKPEVMDERVEAQVESRIDNTRVEDVEFKTFYSKQNVESIKNINPSSIETTDIEPNILEEINVKTSLANCIEPSLIFAELIDVEVESNVQDLSEEQNRYNITKNTSPDLVFHEIYEDNGQPTDKKETVHAEKNKATDIKNANDIKKEKTRDFVRKNKSLQSFNETIHLFENKDRNHTNYRRKKSLADIDLDKKMQGKVHDMIIKMDSKENIFGDEADIQKEVILAKERPRRKSVSEKIALFEAKNLSSTTFEFNSSDHDLYLV